MCVEGSFFFWGGDKFQKGMARLSRKRQKSRSRPRRSRRSRRSRSFRGGKEKSVVDLVLQLKYLPLGTYVLNGIHIFEKESKLNYEWKLNKRFVFIESEMNIRDSITKRDEYKQITSLESNNYDLGLDENLKVGDKSVESIQQKIKETPHVLKQFLDTLEGKQYTIARSFLSIKFGKQEINNILEFKEGDKLIRDSEDFVVSEVKGDHYWMRVDTYRISLYIHDEEEDIQKFITGETFSLTVGGEEGYYKWIGTYVDGENEVYLFAKSVEKEFAHENYTYSNSNNHDEYYESDFLKLEKKIRLQKSKSREG